MPSAMSTIARMARTTVTTVRPDELPGRVEELTGPPCAAAAACRSCRGPNLPATTSAACSKEVAYDIFAKTFRLSTEHPAAIALSHIVHERAQPVVFSEHEDVQRRVPAGHLVDFRQR